MQRVAELRQAVDQMTASSDTPLTMEEIETELHAYREERRRAAGA